MSISEMASATSIWVKQVTTNIVKKKLLEPEGIQGHRWMSYIACFILWTAAVGGGYFYYCQRIEFGIQQMVERIKNDCHTSNSSCQKGLFVVQKLASESGGHIMLEDNYGVRVTLKEFAEIENLISAYISDRKKILAHVTISPLSMTHQQKAGSIDNTSVEIGIAPDNRIVISFTSDIIFNDENVGEARLAILLSDTSPLPQYKILFILWLMMTPVISAIGLFVINMIIRKQLEQKKVRGKFIILTALCLLIKENRTSKKKEEQFGSYRLEGRIARGGMAELFIATKIGRDEFEKTVALKKILPHLADIPEFISRFKSEARRAALLQHPNIVSTYDFDQIGKDYIIEMEYVLGKNLAEIFSQLNKAFDIHAAVYIVSEVCKGLHYAHTKQDGSGKLLKFVHRDISPQNILISYEGEVKICDFGIAKVGVEHTVTKQDELIGKLPYMSPEQISGLPVDHQTDIYALGVLFYEMLTGKRLYNVRTPAQAINLIVNQPVSPVKGIVSDIPDQLNDIVMRCLEKDKQTRYQSAQKLLDDLEIFRYDFKVIYNMSYLSKFMQKHFREKRQQLSQGGFAYSTLWDIAYKIFNS